MKTIRVRARTLSCVRLFHCEKVIKKSEFRKCPPNTIVSMATIPFWEERHHPKYSAYHTAPAYHAYHAYHVRSTPFPVRRLTSTQDSAWLEKKKACVLRIPHRVFERVLQSCAQDLDRSLVGDAAESNKCGHVINIFHIEPTRSIIWRAIRN